MTLPTLNSLASPSLLPALINHLAAEDGHDDFGLQNLRRRDGQQVARVDDEVGEHPGRDLALIFLFKRGVSALGRVAADGVSNRQALLRPPAAGGSPSVLWRVTAA